MPREPKDSTTKDATKTANAKVSKEGKTKRPPSAYNLYMKEHMPIWRKENPDSKVKEAMAAVAQMWRNAPENPNRGKETPAKAPKKPKAVKEAKKKPAAKKSKDAEEGDEEEEPATETVDAAETSEAAEGGEEDD